MNRTPSVSIYPSQPRLIRVFLIYSCFVIVSLFIIVFRDMNPANRVVVVPLGGFLTLYFGWLWAGVLYRLLRRTPTLVVDDEGVIDNSSCIVCGVGRIRWEDMRALVPREDYNEYRGGSRLFGPYLVIYLRDRDAFVSGLPRTIRVLRWLRRFMDWRRGDISIPQFMLDDAVPGIMADIRGRYEHLRHERHTTAHAHPDVLMPY